MRSAQIILILGALSCSEPTATTQRSAIAIVPGQQRPSYFYSINPVDRTVYVAFTSLRRENGERIPAFMRRMFASADSAGAERLVIDVSSLTGSDARLLVPLIKGVATRDHFRHVGALYVIVGPNSYSPWQNAATLLQQYANPIVVESS